MRRIGLRACAVTLTGLLVLPVSSGCRSAPVPTARLHARLFQKYEQGKYEQVIREYENLLAQYPDETSHNNLAWLYATVPDQELRSPEKAIEHATRAVALSGARNDSFLDTLAEAYRVAGQYDAALQALEGALALKPESGEYRKRLELVKREKQGLAVALPGPGQGEKQPSEPVLRAARLFQRANVLLKRGGSARVAQAVELYEEALGLVPDDADIHNNLAVALARLGRRDEARRHAEEAARLAPTVARFHHNLAWIVATEKEPTGEELEAAAASAKRAVQLTDWKNPNALDTLALVYYKIGEWLRQRQGEEAKLVIRGPGGTGEEISRASEAFEKAVEMAVKAVILAEERELYLEHWRKFRAAKEAER